MEGLTYGLLGDASPLTLHVKEKVCLKDGV